MRKKIAIIAEHHNGKPKPVNLELLTAAKKIREHGECDLFFFIMGENMEKAGQKICGQTFVDTVAFVIPQLLDCNGAIVKKVFLDYFTQNPFDYIITSHSTSGMEFAPALSVALKGSCITCVEDIKTENETMLFQRSMMGGKISVCLTPQLYPLVMTIQPGVFKPCSHSKESEKKGFLEKIICECKEDKMIFKGTLPAPATNADLAGADVVVSGGRGIKEEENYKYIRMLAELFPRSATGGSRPICDYGWIPYGKQVGMTGTFVSPELYFACGISGASQHVEAIRDSKFIIALNDDPDALIFRIADVCIVEDLVKFIPLIKEKIEKRKAQI